MMTWLEEWIAGKGFMPHGHCYLWKPTLVWTMFISDLLIGLAYFSISLSLYALVRKIRLPFSRMFLAFGLFIGACGATHFMEVWTLWNPAYWPAAWVKIVTAVASVATGIYMFPVSPKVVEIARAAKRAEEHRIRLEDQTLELIEANRALENAQRLLQDSYSKLDTRVQERTQELRKAVQARDEFLSIASHELKTPLTSLKLHFEIARRRWKKGITDALDQESLLHLIESSSRQVDRLTGLVEDMLDISRIQTGRLTLVPEETDLSSLTQDVIERIEPQLSAAGCRLDREIVSHLFALCDRFRMEQVLINLLSNAAKYGPGKPITLKLLRLDPSRIQIQVRDHGIGIAANDQKKIFERFERVPNKENIGGLGLGLYIVRSIVQSHGGDVRVESAPNQGATFIVEIPIRPDFSRINPESAA